MFTTFGEVGLSKVQFVQTFDCDHKVTVAIVGAGAAGLTAALAAKDTGANVMAVSYTHLTLPTNREV